jgi:hypothetical protein
VDKWKPPENIMTLDNDRGYPGRETESEMGVMQRRKSTYHIPAISDGTLAA